MTVLPAPESNFSLCGMSSRVPSHVVDVCYYSIFPHLQKEKTAMLERCHMQWGRNHLISLERRVSGVCCCDLLSCYHHRGQSAEDTQALVAGSKQVTFAAAAGCRWQHWQPAERNTSECKCINTQTPLILSQQSADTHKVREDYKTMAMWLQVHVPSGTVANRNIWLGWILQTDHDSLI